MEPIRTPYLLDDPLKQRHYHPKGLEDIKNKRNDERVLQRKKSPDEVKEDQWFMFKIAKFIKLFFKAVGDSMFNCSPPKIGIVANEHHIHHIDKRKVSGYVVRAKNNNSAIKGRIAFQHLYSSFNTAMPLLRSGTTWSEIPPPQIENIEQVSA